MNSEIHLYDRNTINTLKLTESELGVFIKNYWVPMMKAGSNHFINNVDSQLYLLAIDDLFLPITINNKELDNSYVCSPYNHYVTYTKEELKTLKTPILEAILAIIIDILGQLLILANINKVAIVYNLLLSTNLYPDISTQQITAITSFFSQKFPDNAIIFRSINTFIDDRLFNSFIDNGYQLIGSRQIYLFNPNERSAMRSKMRWRLKQDFQLITKQGYELIDNSQITQQDIPRIVELYNYLYLDKYSLHNPQFNQEFIKLVLQNPAWRFQAFKKNNQIDGVIGFYEINGVMTTPILGYDTSLPQEHGLYRMLSAQLTVEATKKGIILHQSSGAAEFKRFRGFIANTEYSAVFHQHLPFIRQLVWRFLGLLVNKIALPLMKKYKL
ncbi:MAG: hypothetical protein QNJ51_09015 [Calothrix sp. MO_167.B12]|nr:hypothetical protein [Calothrix sp. MO_167.B12]